MFSICKIYEICYPSLSTIVPVVHAFYFWHTNSNFSNCHCQSLKIYEKIYSATWNTRSSGRHTNSIFHISRPLKYTKKILYLAHTVYWLVTRILSLSLFPFLHCHFHFQKFGTQMCEIPPKPLRNVNLVYMCQSTSQKDPAVAYE